MKFWITCVIMLFGAIGVKAAEHRYLMTGRGYAACGGITVTLGPHIWSFPVAGQGTFVTLTEMVSFQDELTGNTPFSWFIEQCCTNCELLTGTAKIDDMSGCYILFVTQGSWQVALYFTEVGIPTTGYRECGRIDVSAKAWCGNVSTEHWYVSNDPNPSGSNWQHLGVTNEYYGFSITPELITEKTSFDPYGPLYLRYRKSGEDYRDPVDGGWSDPSLNIPIDFLIGAPTMNLVPTAQFCALSGGVTLTDVVAPLPQVLLIVQKDLGDNFWQEKVNKSFNREELPNKFFELDPGNYRIAVYNEGEGGGCSTTIPFEVTGRYPKVDITANVIHEKCFGTPGTGSIALTPGGAEISPPFTYAWAHNAALHDQNLTNLAGDVTYHVTVTDANGCFNDKDITVNEPEPILITEAFVSSDHNGSDVSCPANTVGIQNDGAIHLAAHGGTDALSFRLVGDVYATPYQTSGDFPGLRADNYKIRVKDSKDCEIELDPGVSVVAPKDIRHSRMTIVPLRCHELAEGSITIVNARGGTGALQFGIADAAYQTSNIISNRLGQTYTISIRDINGCRRDTSVVVGQPEAIVFDPFVLTPQSCSSKVDGTLTALAKGGKGAIQYALSDTDASYTPSGVFNTLAEGSYTVYARDANRCVVHSDAQAILLTPAMRATIAIKDSISCKGKTDGALRLTIDGGGNTPYAIQWDNRPETTAEITGLRAAMYSVTVTDAKACSQQWKIPLDEPATLTAQPQVSNFRGFEVRCHDGTDGAINLQVLGGSRPYRYTWSDGIQTKDRTALPQGTYTVLVTDRHNCTTSLANIQLDEPPAVILRVAGQKNISCRNDTDGRITLEATGGVGPYEYSRDQNIWQGNPLFTGLPAGDYTLYAHDSNNCPTEPVSPSLTQPKDALTLAALGKNETTCGQEDGMVWIKLNGGTPGYTYAWYDDDKNIIATADRAEKLAAGDYRVVGTDANNCQVEEKYTINDSDGPKIAQNFLKPLTCHTSNDGEISVTVAAGPDPYTISWDIPNEHGLSVSNLTEGIHWIKVSDSRNCQNKKEFKVEAPKALSFTPTLALPRCYGEANGSIDVVVAGGNPGGYTYTWTGSPETGPRREGLTAGQYILTARDIKNCTLEQEIILQNPPRYTVDAGGDRAICVGQQLPLAVPADAVSCLWTSDAGYSSNDRQVILTVPARYTLHVTNANGCEAEDYFTIATADNLLEADFLMAANAIAGDTVILIDISWPAPDNIGWNLPPGTQIVSADNAYASVIFPEAGDYEVVLNTHLGECMDDLKKYITIIGAPPTENSREQVSALKRFELYPNPSNGAFAVQLEFAGAGPGNLTLMGLSGNQALWHQTLPEQRTQEVQVTVLNLPAGIYLLVLERGGKRYYKRVLKK